MIVLKDAPKGVDVQIDRLQKYLYDRILTNNPSNTWAWNSYHRANMNPTRLDHKKYIAEVYTEDGEYIDVYLDDSVSVTSFFIVDPVRQFVNGKWKVKVSMIVQSLLDEVKVNVSHRADEEHMNDFVLAINKLQNVSPLISVETEIDDVYKEFEKEKLRLDNIGTFHVMRFNFELSYELSC